MRGGASFARRRLHQPVDDLADRNGVDVAIESSHGFRSIDSIFGTDVAKLARRLSAEHPRPPRFIDFGSSKGPMTMRLAESKTGDMSLHIYGLPGTHQGEYIKMGLTEAGLPRERPSTRTI